MDHKFKVHRTNPIAQYKNQLRRMLLLADHLAQTKPVTMADHKSFYRYRAPNTKANDVVEVRIRGDLSELESLLVSDDLVSGSGRTSRDHIEQCLIALFREITARHAQHHLASTSNDANGEKASVLPKENTSEETTGAAIIDQAGMGVDQADNSVSSGGGIGDGGVSDKSLDEQLHAVQQPKKTTELLTGFFDI